MATTEEPTVSRAEDRAWEVFFDSLDPDREAAAWIPPGAAIIAADSPDRDFLIRRYHADRRPVVLVDADGRTKTLRPRPLDREQLLILSGAVLVVWLVLRSGSKAPSYLRALRAVGA